MLSLWDILLISGPVLGFVGYMSWLIGKEILINRNLLEAILRRQGVSEDDIESIAQEKKK